MFLKFCLFFKKKIFCSCAIHVSKIWLTASTLPALMDVRKKYLIISLVGVQITSTPSPVSVSFFKKIYLQEDGDDQFLISTIVIS